MTDATTRRHVLRGLAFGTIAGGTLALGACSTIPARDPAAGPVVLERDFAGRFYGRGFFRNALTGSRRDFDVKLEGRWDGRTLTLVEWFEFADGERDVKTWRFTRTGPGRFAGTREDVVGEAVVVSDNGAIRLSYEAVVGGTQVRFEDVIERRPDGVIVNRAIVSKLGIPIGEVDLVFARNRARLP
jgi:hypothetical protein